VSLSQLPFDFHCLYTLIEKSPATPSKSRAGVAALLPPPINLATKPRPSHQLPANNTKQPKCGNRTLVPVYVLPEHLKAVQAFILSLGQTLAAPESERANCDPFLQPEELDGANSSDSDNSVELVSLSSWMSISNISTPSSLSTSNISTPSASSLRNRAPAFTTKFSARAPAIPSAGDILLGSSTSPHMRINKYYSILIGKKTGVFWDQW
jgi:hypothetical protein